MASASVITCVVVCATLVIDCCTGHNCSHLLSALDERSNTAYDDQSYQVKFGHSFLDVSNGYVPNVRYSMTITSPSSAFVQELVVMSLSIRRSKRESIGIFDYDRKHFTLLKCKPTDKELGDIDMLWAMSSNGSALHFPQTITWMAPRDTSPDCALFKIAFASAEHAGRWAVLRERMCKNRGMYHFVTGQSGAEEFSWQGPTTRTLIAEASESSSVYAQIIRASYSGPAGEGVCAGTTVRVSTDAVERNFTTYSRRMCFADAVSQPTDVFRSSNGVPVVIIEIAIASTGHFSFEFSYYSLPREKGCNVTVIHRKSGTIQSPNYPSDYYGGMDCYYTLEVEKEERIVGHFVELQLDQHTHSGTSQSSPSETCAQGDFIHLTSSHQSSKWCGEISADQQSIKESGYGFQSADDTLIAHFHSDPRHGIQTRSHQRYRFKIVWQARASCPPSQKFTGMRGRMTSVNYPKPYLNSQRCEYNIEVPRGFVVQLRFRDFRLQPTDRFVANCQDPPHAHDYVKVGERKFCGNWTGREAEGLVFRSIANFMSFTFVSDEWTAFNGGFSAEFRAVTPNETYECRPGQSFFGGLCYDVKDYAADWTTALRNCQQGGGILAIVTSEAKQHFLNRLLALIDSSEDRAYWIGGTDSQYESDFTWITGERVSYSNWFQGWPAFSSYNKQPNDDGLSQQNCLELRRRFAHPSKGHGYAEEFFWNDRHCDAQNGFICQYARTGASPLVLSSEQTKYTNCNETIILTTSAWRATVSSPRYPEPYPDFANCYVTIAAAAPGYVLILDFNKFVLEDHKGCGYDYLEIWEESIFNRNVQSVANPIKLCGDKSEELKLLRRTVADKRIILHFFSDHSRVYAGFHSTVYMDDAELSRTLNLCNDKNWLHFEECCYLLIYYPVVDWKTAKQICASSGNSLAVPQSSEEETFLAQEILGSADYKVSDALWLGARRSAPVETWKLENGERRFNYTDWFPKNTSVRGDRQIAAKDVCLTIQQQFHAGSGSAAPITAQRPYWGQKLCNELAGYVCKARKPLVTEGQRLNDTFFVNGSGTLTLPCYPSLYPNFFDYSAHLASNENTRILITFQWVDVEYQRNCSYDYVHLKTFEDDIPMNICGSITDRKPSFASSSNQALLSFHSDSSITGRGFMATWQVISISDCYVDTDQPSGFINSVNFPDFYLNALDCTSTIRAPAGARVLLDFVYFDVGNRSDHGPFRSACHDTDYVSIYLDGEYSGGYVRLCSQLNLANASQGLLFVSRANVLRVVFHSDAALWGVGYRARYDSVHGSNVTLTVFLNETTRTVSIPSPNYPLPFPNDLCLQHVYHVRYGYQIIIEFQELDMEFYRVEGDTIFIRDSYQDGYGGISHNVTTTTYWNKLTLDVCSNQSIGVTDQSEGRRRYKAVLTVVEDALFWRNKSLSNYSGLIETCHPSPCRNGGTCELGPDGYYCRCRLSYLGAFCHVSPCDLHPCMHGTCVVTADNHHCDCQPGYEGAMCDEAIHRCASNPCQHGTCTEGLDSYTCVCMNGYKGDNCQKADLLNATTLRESFIRDPFWLGLFLVLAVISIVGITRCFRKRFKYSGFTRIQEEDEVIGRTEAAEVESAEPEHAAALLSSCLSTANTLNGGEGEDEVCFTLRDLGIGPSHYRNLGHFENVSFKLRLADLTQQELDTLEAYLQHIEATMEGTSPSEDAQLREGGVTTPSARSPILHTTQFATALESVTGIILKSAEIVDGQQIRDEAHEMKLASRQSAAAFARRAPVKQVQAIRGAAWKALQMVRSVELAEIKDLAHTKARTETSFTLGQISPAPATATTYSAEC